jgi:hypothetical protein
MSFTRRNLGFNVTIYGNQWGSAGGSATQVNAPEPLAEALSYSEQTINQSADPQGLGRFSVADQMGRAKLLASGPESAVPTGTPNMG